MRERVDMYQMEPIDQDERQLQDELNVMWVELWLEAVRST